MTAESYTPDGFFKTGDRGERDGEGRLKITGRVKELLQDEQGQAIRLAPAPIEESAQRCTRSWEMSCVAGSGQPPAPRHRRALGDAPCSDAQAIPRCKPR